MNGGGDVDRMHDLSGFQRDVLYVIANLDRPTGQTVKAELETYYGDEIKNGRLYPNLDALVREGLVEKGRVDGRANAYTLTQRGGRAIEARQEWEKRQLRDSLASAPE